MSLSIQKMVSDGTLSTIVLGVQYLQRDDVYMRIAGVETPQSGAPSGFTWSFLDNNTIRVLPVVPAGVEVVVYRRTDLDEMYNIYSQNAQFDESTIDENNQQLLYIAQEYFEQGIPAQLIEGIEYVREDTANMYYRLKLSDGSYTAEFPVPKGEAVGFEALRRSYAEAGLNLVAGSFENGGTLTNSNDVLLLIGTGIAYSYSGTLPHAVDPATDPTKPDSGYVSVASSTLRGDLASNNTGKGSSIIGTLSGLTVQQVLDHLSGQFSNAFFNVRDYGAVGDGTTDDTTAIQDAINAASNGGTLYFPHGTYITTQTLNLSGKKMRLLGDGLNQSIIKANRSMTYLIAAVEGSTTYSFNEFSMENLQFDSNNLSNTTFNLEHRHYCTFRSCAFFNAISYAHTTKNSWLNNYYNCIFGAAPTGVALLGSNHRNAFHNCSWMGNSSICLSVADGADGNSALAWYNCDFEFQNGSNDVTAIYINAKGTFNFHDCYIGEEIKGTIIYMAGDGVVNIDGGVLFNGVSPTGSLFRTAGAGEIIVRGSEIVGGSYASISSLGSKYGTKFSLENCRLGFATLGVRTLVSEGLRRISHPNPVISNGKGWTLNVLDGTATQTISGIAKTCTVTSPSTSGTMLLTSPLDQNKLSSGLGASGRYSRVIVTYQSNANVNLYTVNTPGGAGINSLGSLPLSPTGKSCAVIAADITGGSYLEIMFAAFSGATFTLYDVTVIDASDCTIADAASTMTSLFKAK